MAEVLVSQYSETWVSTCSTETRLVPLPKFSNSSLYASCPTGESDSAAAMVCGRVPFIVVVAADRLEPAEELQRRVLLRPEAVELALGPGGEGEQLQHVRPEEPGRVEHGELAGDQRAAVAAVGAVGLVAEPAHQGVVRPGHPGHRPAAVDHRRAEPEAGHRRDDDVEGVLGPAAVGDRVGQRPDHVQELGERAGVGVQEQQRGRLRLGGADVHEVDRLAVDLGDEVGHGVHPGLLGAPVELPPGLDHPLQVGDRGAVVPAVAGRGAGKRVAASRRCRSSSAAWSMWMVYGVIWVLVMALR